MEKLKTSKSLSEIFDSTGKSRTFEKNKLIYNQGETANYFYYLKKGRAHIFITSENGIEKTLSIAGKGEIIGEAAFFDGKPRMSAARALSDCEVVSLDKEMLMELIQNNPQIAFDLFGLQAKTIRKLSSQLDNMTFVSAKGRICRFLIQSLKTSADNKITATHEEIANVIGVQRVTVSKIMIQLVKDGVLKTGYKCIEVLDKDTLLTLCE